MLIIPFEIENDIRKLPIITFAITLFCIVIFIMQTHDETRYKKMLDIYCNEMRESTTWLTIRDLGANNDKYLCERVMSEIRRAENQQAEIMKFAESARESHIFVNRADEVSYTYDVIEREYEHFQQVVPLSFRQEWMFQPLNYTMSQFFTSSTSHADLRHLTGNMLFFLVFSCTLELLIGHVCVLLFYIFAAFVSHLSFSHAVYIGFYPNVPSLGLSGVISAAMALLAVLLPWSKISIVVWGGFFVLPIRLPIFLLVGWYIYWDYYYMKLYGAETCVGHVAHLGGAAAGIIVGLLCHLLLREHIQRRAKMVKGL